MVAILARGDFASVTDLTWRFGKQVFPADRVTMSSRPRADDPDARVQSGILHGSAAGDPRVQPVDAPSASGAHGRRVDPLTDAMKVAPRRAHDPARTTRSKSSSAKRKSFRSPRRLWALEANPDRPEHDKPASESSAT